MELLYHLIQSIQCMLTILCCTKVRMAKYKFPCLGNLGQIHHSGDVGAFQAVQISALAGELYRHRHVCVGGQHQPTLPEDGLPLEHHGDVIEGTVCFRAVNGNDIRPKSKGNHKG